MNKNYNIKKYHFEIYNFDVIYCEYYQSYFQDLLDVLKKRYKLDYSTIDLLSDCHGLCYSTGNERKFYIFINLSKNKSKKRFINTLSHEIYHVVEDVKTYFDLTYQNGKANESLAYLIGAISEKLLYNIITKRFK